MMAVEAAHKAKKTTTRSDKLNMEAFPRDEVGISLID